MRFCPNKSSELYKELLKINNNSQGLATGAYSVITTLQDKGLLSEKRFNLNGKMVYTIPMKNYDINSIPQQLKGNFSKEKNIDAALELERYLTERHLSWIQTKETTNTYIIELKPIPVTERQSQMFNLAPSTPTYNIENIVQYSPKVLEVVQKNLIKLNIWFKQLKDTDQFWKKVQSDLAIPKEQVELLRQSKGDTIEQKLVDFVSKYSYTVEINTAKEKSSMAKEIMSVNGFSINGDIYDRVTDEDIFGVDDREIFTKNNKEISEQEYRDALFEYNNRVETPTQHYSILSAPSDTAGRNKYEGNPDWEYQELAIQTPLIINASVAHINDFSGGISNMLGWARVWYNKKTGVVEVQEIQSDLFQKGRDKKDLVGLSPTKTTIWNGDSAEDYTIPGTDKSKSTENQFLQLLNKDNTWVTFFIKSIIQDSAKKGYKKVLFPTGNTASKVEGHTTLEEFKKQKEDRIELLEFNKSQNNNNIKGEYLSNEQIDNEINQLKQELERVEKEGFGALKPIYKFYENTVKNILKKNYSVKETADEYGNTWNEVILVEKHNEQILLQLNNKGEKTFDKRLNEKLISILTGLGIRVEFLDNLSQDNATGLWDSFNKIIQVAKDKQSLETLPEEAAHAIIDGLLGDPSVQNLIKQVNKLGYKNILGEQTAEYEKLYNNDVDLLNKEVAGKLLAKAFINNFESSEQSNILNNICKFIWNKFKLLFKTISGETVKSIQDEVDEITNKLAKSVLSGELTNLDFSYNTKKAILYNVKSKLKKKDRYFEQIVELKRSVARNDKLLKVLDKTTNKYKVLEERTNLMRESLRDYEINKKEDSLKKSATYQLQLIEGLLNAYDNGFKPEVNDIRIAYSTLKSLNNIVGLGKYVTQEGLDISPDELLYRVDEIQREYADQIIINASNEEVKLTSEDISNQDTDINKFTMGFGTLTNVTNYIARTIGTLIKSAQVRISRKQGAIYQETKNHVDKLKQWGKDNGVKDIYSHFIQNNRSTTVLTRQWSEQFYTDLEENFKTGNNSWKLIATRNSDGAYIPINTKKYENSNYKIIQSNKVLKEFYDFYQKTMKDSMDRLPTHLLNGVGGYYKEGFIANIVRDDLQHLLSAPTVFGKAKQLFGNITNIRVKETKETGFIDSEILQKDEIPVQFLKKITSEDKSNDLGEALYKFAAFTISHEELTEVLPQARLLENRLHSQREFIKASNPNQTVTAEDSNLAKMVKKTIEMQLLGKTKEDQGKINLPKGEIYDKNGEVIGHKYITASSIADFGLKYNSLLRIGFNPFNAITNVVIGEISTAMEAIGGRYFNKKDLTNATTTFFKEINNKESKTKKFLEIFNPLQELEDYDYARNVSIKSNIGEKIKSYLYAPQKTGELFLQTRTMIAMLKHKTFKFGAQEISFWDLLNDQGQLKDEYKSLMTKDELDNLITAFSAKIQAVNSKMHGRYSQRDAAIINQNILWRMAFQFKKWIPAAIEVRLGTKQFDNTLEDIQEGRWKTFSKMLWNFQNTYSRLQHGQLEEYEIYNFKKTATEIVILIASIVLFYGLKWDDDEDRKNDAWYKFTMDQLDKVSGDLLFLAKPRNITKASKTPFAITKLAEQILDLGSSIPTLFGYEEMNYLSGPNKGKNKVLTNIIGLTPGLKPFNEVAKIFNEQKYQSYH